MRRFVKFCWMTGLVFASACLSVAVSAAEFQGDRRVLGWAEPVRLYPGEFSLRAKLDTGAETSSLHARNIERYTEQGMEWVRFEIFVDGEDTSIKMERPLVRIVRIRQIGRDALVRPVVELGVCIDDYYRGDVQFGLEDRSGFDYPVLLGRRFLADAGLVDPGRNFLSEPNCAY